MHACQLKFFLNLIFFQASCLYYEAQIENDDCDRDLYGKGTPTLCVLRE